MNRPLAVFDLDGTLTRHDTLAPFLLGFLWRHPWRLPRLLALVPAALHFLAARDRGAFKGSVLRATLGGVRREALDAWARRFVQRLLRTGLYADALQRIETHRQRGDRLVILSASTDLYVPRIARALGVDEAVCTGLRWREDGRLDGRLATANCSGAEKQRCLEALIARDAPTRVSAYANSSSDLAHLQLVQDAYLVNGSRRTRAHARAAGHIRCLRWRGRARPRRP